MRHDFRLPADLGAMFCDHLLGVEDVEMFYGAQRNTFRKAVNLRKQQTTAEELLWSKLRQRQLEGFRFRRQHPIGTYIVDFYCHQAKLVIEVDGGIHTTDEQIKYDAKRTLEISSLGIQVIRFTNHQILHEVDEVLKAIKSAPPCLPFRRGREVRRP